MKGATVWFHEAQSCRVLTLGSGSVKVGNNIVDLVLISDVAGREQSDVFVPRSVYIIETKDVTIAIR